MFELKAMALVFYMGLGPAVMAPKAPIFDSEAACEAAVVPMRNLLAMNAETFAERYGVPFFTFDFRARCVERKDVPVS